MMSTPDKEKINSTILIADDDPSTRMLLRATISQWNYHIVEACDGAEAWEFFQSENCPQIATVDWMMPKINGVELCRLAKTLPRRPYIILLTSMTGTDNAVNALDSGADDFLTKPFNYMELRSRLHVGQRIINFNNKLETLIEEKKPNRYPDFKELISITDNMSEISDRMNGKLDMLQNHIKSKKNWQLDDQSAFIKSANEIYQTHKELSKEIKSLMRLLESRCINDDNHDKPIKKKSKNSRKKS